MKLPDNQYPVPVAQDKMLSELEFVKTDFIKKDVNFIIGKFDNYYTLFRQFDSKDSARFREYITTYKFSIHEYKIIFQHERGDSNDQKKI